MNGNHRRNTRDGHNSRRLRFEALESRQMLAGLVDIVLGGGTLALNGGASSDDVTLAYGTNAGSYVVTGNNGTLLRLNGAGQTFNTPVPVDGISGNVTVSLGGGGTDTFTFNGTVGLQFPIPNLTINNGGGVDTNTLNSALIGGAFNVNKGGIGTSDLTINNSTIVGLTTINNGGAPGDSHTNINSTGTGTKSDLQGGLQLTNGNGDNSFSTSGTTFFGAALFPIPIGGAPLPVVVTINNNPGGMTNGSSTIFAGATTIYGSVNIRNGGHLALQQDLVTFNGALVLGGVTTNSDGGTSSVTVTNNSKLGTQLAQTNGGPLVITNNSALGGQVTGGAAQVTITGSSTAAPVVIPWGVFINDGPGAGYGSTTTITNSLIGTRPGGLSGLAPPPFAVAGDALTFVGENGFNKFTMTSTTVGGGIVRFGGAGPAFLPGTSNAVKFEASTLVGLNLATDPAGGNNSVTLDRDNIQVSLVLNFAHGANYLNTVNTSTLTTAPLTVPDPLTGIITVTGTGGLDTWFNGAGVAITGITGFVPGTTIVVVVI